MFEEIKLVIGKVRVLITAALIILTYNGCTL